MATNARFVRDTIWMTGGLLVWAAHLGVAYAVAAVACARRLEHLTTLGFPAAGIVLGVITLVALGAGAMLLRSALRETRAARDTTRRFVARIAALAAGFSLVAVAWTGLPMLLVTPCGRGSSF